MPDYTPIAVAYKKKSGTKIWVKEFTDQRTPDKLLSKRTKILPAGCEIVELGVGSGFFEKYKNKYGN